MSIKKEEKYQMDELPQYKDIIEYYLRDDVLAFLWQLSQTRHLKFFHHCGSDLRTHLRDKPEGISIHCIKSIEDLRKRIIEATQNMPSYPYVFFPFWGMQSTQVNIPGSRDDIIGWDMRYEFDFDQNNSFNVVLPMAGILQHFGVQYILKYSGHRSLHLIIPAEAFPIDMKNDVEHKRWMDVFDLIGDLFCRITPYLNHTSTGLSKETVLTTPYSFHRYNGLISIPLSIKNAINFDSSIAHLANFPGVVWQIPSSNNQGIEMERLIKFARKVQRNPYVAIERVPEAFIGVEWDDFFNRIVPDGINPYSVIGILIAGTSGLSRKNYISKESHFISHRLRQAISSIDNPINKSIKRLNLVGEIGFNIPFDTIVMNRKLNAEVLSEWVHGGCESALERILEIMNDTHYKSPFLLALRLCTILPENRNTLREKLLDKWHGQSDRSGLKRLFITLAIGQLGTGNLSALDTLSNDIGVDHFVNILQTEEIWYADVDLEKTLAVLSIEYGLNKVRTWVSEPNTDDAQLVIQNVFGGKLNKFQYAARRLQ